jgi:hypothetical protein
VRQRVLASLTRPFRAKRTGLASKHPGIALGTLEARPERASHASSDPTDGPMKNPPSEYRCFPAESILPTASLSGTRGPLTPTLSPSGRGRPPTDDAALMEKARPISPSPRRGEGARRAGEGARRRAQQMRPVSGASRRVLDSAFSSTRPTGARLMRCTWSRIRSRTRRRKRRRHRTDPGQAQTVRRTGSGRRQNPP